jgi:hypothetical protein
MAKISALPSPFSPRPQTEWFGGKNSLCALPRGAITEICGQPSSGRASLAHSMLATATAAGEVAAVVDTSNAFDPATARRSGVQLGKLLWVQCGHRVETALKAADMILHSGGFGLVLLDLCDARPGELNRVTSPVWYRFQRAVEHTPAVLLILARQPVARSCAARQIRLEQHRFVWRGAPPFQVIEKLELEAVSQKPVLSAPVRLEALVEA